MSHLLTRLLQIAKIDIAASGSLLAANAGQGYRVYWLWLFNTALTTTLQFKDGTTALTGVITQLGSNILVLPFTGEAYFTVSQGNAFTLTLGASTQVSGALGYQVTGG